MKRTLACLGGMLAVAFVASQAAAQYAYPATAYSPNQPGYVVRVAPDMCGPYFYCTNGATWYGPSYYVYPPFPPVGGIQPPVNPMQQNNVALPYNPFMRGPRDYFMWSEAQKSLHTREVRPPFGP